MNVLRKLVLAALLLLAFTQVAQAQVQPDLKTKWPPAGWGAISWGSCAPFTSCVRVAYFSVWDSYGPGTYAHAFAGVTEACALDVFKAYPTDSSGNLLYDGSGHVIELGLASQAYTDYFDRVWPHGAVKLGQRYVAANGTLYYRADYAWDPPLSQFDECEHAIEVRPGSTYVDGWPADNFQSYSPNF